MLTLYLLRHGETDWNKIGRFQGWTDIPLNETGKTQAKKLTPIFQNTPFLHCVSSDLVRAKETMEIALGKSPLMHTDIRLREIFCGAWEGETVETLRSNKEEIDNYFLDPINFPPREGETITQLTERASAVIDELIEQYRYDQGNILVTSHGGTIRAILSHLLSSGIQSWNSFQIDNCGVAKVFIEPTGRKRLALLNG